MDYNTNQNVYNFSKPLSHAALLKLYIENKYPVYEVGEIVINQKTTEKTIKHTKLKKKAKKTDITKDSSQLELFNT